MANQVEITRQHVAAHNATSPQGAEIMANVTGQRNHQKVLATSINAQITDAAEEIGMSVAHRADKHTLGVRSIRKGQSTDLRALSRIAEFYDKLPDMPRQDRLRQLIDRFENYARQLGQRGSGGRRDNMLEKQQLLTFLQQFDPDVTHQYAALSLVREHFRKKRTGVSDSGFETLLDEAAGEFERTDVMRDVQAGFASARIAHLKASVLGTGPVDIRESYRGLLRESKHFGQLFDSLSKFDVKQMFDDVIDTFIETAANDLSGTNHSTEPAFLGELLTELGKLKKLKTVHQSVGELVSISSRSIPAIAEHADQIGSTSKLFHFCSKPTSSRSDARRLVEALKVDGPLAQLAFANGLRDLHSDVPDEVMPSIAAKRQQALAIRSLLDELVAEEEHAYEQLAETAPQNRTHEVRQ